jgi:hypothetical protein
MDTTQFPVLPHHKLIAFSVARNFSSPFERLTSETPSSATKHCALPSPLASTPPKGPGGSRALTKPAPSPSLAPRPSKPLPPRKSPPLAATPPKPPRSPWPASRTASWPSSPDSAGDGVCLQRLSSSSAALSAQSPSAARARSARPADPKDRSLARDESPPRHRRGALP